MLARVATAAAAFFFIATTSSAQQEPDGFRFHGYLRSGFGVAEDGKPQEAFKAPNTLAKYRLGNETEAYLETTFAYGVRPEDDPKTFFDTRITVSYVTPTSNTNNFETTTALREAFVLAQGVWHRQERATFWAGQRFYDRHDLHMDSRLLFLLRLEAGGHSGWGECVAGEEPLYSYETVGTALHVIREHLAPALLGQEIGDLADLTSRLGAFRGHPMVKRPSWCVIAIGPYQASANAPA